ncbi:MAG: PLP-dependent aminotransferase family protein [Candidatus Cloacimonadaceae bacterium]|nr:PLP-dependent aminotransferase family protein [Candidatus Cloacimonadaceae bacterium]
MNYSNEFSRVSQSMKSSMIRELVATTKNVPDMISFAGGFPAPATFPKQMLSEIFEEVVKLEGYDVLQYGASEGDALLKQQLLKWEGYDKLSLDEMLITNGATNAIYYYGKALLDPGDVVLCEAPTFLGSLVAFDALEAELHGIGMDESGIDMNLLSDRVKSLKKIGKRIKLLYTIPDFQNPGGITMSLPRRRELIAFCIEHEIPILEDNPYSRLRYTGKPLPTLFHLAHHDFQRSDIVTEAVSFSKIIGPGMRVAYVKGSKELVEKMGSWQQKVNVTPDCVSQRVVARFLEMGFMPGHINTICHHYHPYLRKMLEELQINMPESVYWTKPEGGIFVWLELPEHINADELFIKARDHKVSFIPGSKFYPTGQERFNALRLKFTYSSLEQIEIGIKRLGQLLKDESA